MNNTNAHAHRILFTVLVAAFLSSACAIDAAWSDDPHVECCWRGDDPDERDVCCENRNAGPEIPQRDVANITADQKTIIGGVRTL